MDIYQLREEGAVSCSMTDEVLCTRKQAMGTYFNKEGKEVACVSTPIFDEGGDLCMVVTYSCRLDILETVQKELQQEKETLKGYQAAMEMLVHVHLESCVAANDPATRKVFSTLESLARMDSTIMLCGESGVGWESCGAAAAHMLGTRLADFPQLHGVMHGEKVSFGIVAQLMLDPETDMAAAGELVDFMVRLGLPVTMEKLDWSRSPRRTFWPGAAASVSPAAGWTASRPTSRRRNCSGPSTAHLPLEKAASSASSQI